MESFVERRSSERIQFFSRPTENVFAVDPVSSLRQADTIFGLLIDVSDFGVQIITQKQRTALPRSLDLLIQAPGGSRLDFAVARLDRLWSKVACEHYIQHGFAFRGTVQLAPLLDGVLSARDSGLPWLRCGLRPLRVAAALETAGTSIP